MNDILLRTFKLLSEQRREQKDLAEAINVKPQVISDWKSGKTKSYTKYIDQIASFFGVSVDYLLGKSPVRHNTMEILRTDSSSYVPIPVVGSVAAGYTALAETDIIGYELVDTSVLTDGYEYAWLKVKGDSMAPLILEGDLVLIRLQEEVDSGDLAVVIVDEEDGVIKRVQYSTNKVTLVSENADNYPPRVFSGKDVNRLRIWGKAVEIKRKLN
jgi:repressor LexA